MSGGRATRSRAAPARGEILPRISVAICTYDRYTLLPACLARLVRQSLAVDAFEVLVIDNSPDAARSAREALAFRSLPNLHWQHLTQPGLSHARNAALAAARAPIIAYIDDDALAEPEWLEAILQGFATLGPKVAAIGGRVLPAFVQPPPDWLSQDLVKFLSVLDLGASSRLLADNEYVVGANVAYRCAAVAAVGGFNTALGRRGFAANLMSNEETELATRLKQAGGLIGYVGGAQVAHRIETQRLRQSWFRQRAAWQAVSDFVVAPASQLEVSGQAWQDAKGFLASRPAHLRTLRALGMEQSHAGDLVWQVGAIYSAVTALLGGADDAAV